MFIQELTSRFRNFTIEVAIDPLLLPTIDDNDKITTDRTISFNLYKLIYAIGTIQTRRFAPSNRMKFLDKSDLIEKIHSNTHEFRVKLGELRDNNGSEVLSTISEDFGVGISVIVAEALYNIRFSTIQRIYGHDKRPDWKCQTTDNRTLIIESKGTSYQVASVVLGKRALIQKTKRNGDVKIASISVFNEDNISTNRFLDPPIVPGKIDSEMQNKILRAGHYSSVFSFLGFPLLSRYYSQMRDRLLKSISPEEQIDKNSIFFRLRDNFPNIEYRGNDYSGSFYHLEGSKYIFIGIDRSLISYEGFLHFIDYESEINEIIKQNHYILFKDGILIIEIKNIEEFTNIVDANQILNYQDNITISDIDSMTESSFSKYFNYLLKQNGFETQNESKSQKGIPDIIAFKDNASYAFEIKLFRHRKVDVDIFNRLLINYELTNFDKIILITNVKIINDLKINDKRIIIIDRNELIQILKSNLRLNAKLNQ